MSDATRTRVLFALAAVCLLTALVGAALRAPEPKPDAPRSVSVLSACGRIESVRVTMESGKFYSMEERRADCAEPIDVTIVPVLEAGAMFERRDSPAIRRGKAGRSAPDGGFVPYGYTVTEPTPFLSPREPEAQNRAWCEREPEACSGEVER